MRLDKYLAETAQCTRSEAKALLAKGRVTVNGAVCRKRMTDDVRLPSASSMVSSPVCAPSSAVAIPSAVLNVPVSINPPSV